MHRLLVIAFLLFPVFRSNAFQHYDKQDIALNKVKELVEVKNFLLKTPKEYLPVAIIDGQPTKAFTYYVVSVGVANRGQFRTSMRFYVHATTMKIYYCDWLSPKQPLMTLEQWRQKNIAKRS